MVYLDTSVALAHLLAEDRVPPPALWSETLVSSRLLEYELWARLHGRGLGRSHADVARGVLARLALVELAPPVLVRATEPFPGAPRTLDALHLATVDFLRGRKQSVRFATYDARQAAIAMELDIPLFPL